MGGQHRAIDSLFATLHRMDVAPAHHVLVINRLGQGLADGEGG